MGDIEKSFDCHDLTGKSSACVYYSSMVAEEVCCCYF